MCARCTLHSTVCYSSKRSKNNIMQFSGTSVLFIPNASRTWTKQQAKNIKRTCGTYVKYIRTHIRTKREREYFCKCLHQSYALSKHTRWWKRREKTPCYLFYFSFSFHYVVFDVFVAFRQHRRKLKMYDNSTSTSVNYTYHFPKRLAQGPSTKCIEKKYVRTKQKKRNCEHTLRERDRGRGTEKKCEA